MQILTMMLDILSLEFVKSLTKADLGGARKGGQKGLPYHATEIRGRTVSYSPQKKKHQQERKINYRP